MDKVPELIPILPPTLPVAGDAKTIVECLVPISLSLSIEGIDVHDAFLWNLHETHITPLDFAKIFAQDLVLPEKCIVPIANTIKAQLDRHRTGLLPTLDLDDKGEEICYIPIPIKKEEPQPECLCIIQIHLTLNDINIRDQFEWDLNADEKDSNPELFAKIFCLDMGLPREFQVIISHSIREQLTVYRKLIRKGDFQQRAAVTQALRPAADDRNFTPIAGTTTSNQQRTHQRLKS